MDGGHVWRLGACSNSDGVPNDQNKIFNGIMLRFRPIAPKPVTGTSSGLSPTNQTSPPGKRTKRKYVRIRRNNGYVRKNNNGNKSSSEKATERTDELENVAVVTLQLMPEKEETEGSSLAGDDSWCKNMDLDVTLENIQILENPKPEQENNAGKVLDLVTTAEKTVGESLVTVESVTSTCMGEGEGLGCTDVDKVKNLETDTCPGFVSDGYSRVIWVNEAYKRMVVNDEEEEREVVVWLKVKESVAWCYCYPAFTCGVRLQYTWRNEKCTKMVPCDVWRLDCGGFAWRLDVKAALSLGL